VTGDSQARFCERLVVKFLGPTRPGVRRRRFQIRNQSGISLCSSSHCSYILESMDEYEVHWRELKRRRNLALFAFAGYVPITFAFGVLAENYFHTDKPVFVFAISWMLLVAITGVRHSMFPCPRCGKWFFSTWVESRCDAVV
jgi:hypothetical protein